MDCGEKKKHLRAILWIEIAKLYYFSKMEGASDTAEIKTKKNKHRFRCNECIFIVDSGHCYNEEGGWSVLDLVSSFNTNICVLNDVNAFILSKLFLW